MNQKKILSTIIIGMMLASMAIAIAPTVTADQPDYDVNGLVYVDGQVTDGVGVEVTLSVPDYDDITDTTIVSGWYKISFYAEEGQTANFEVRVGYNYFIPVPATLLVDKPSPPKYSFNDYHLSVDTWNTHQPNKPVLVAPSNGKEFDSGTSSVTLKVDVSDPDGDWMDVYFYNAGDDSLIGTAIGIPDDGTAQVGWSGLADDTTYSWYAIANDSIKESESSDTWSFKIKAEPYTPPDPDPPYTPPGDGDGDDDEGEEDEEPEPTPNNPPTTPDITGNASGSKDVNFTYSALSTDPDGHNISYIFNWGDGTNTTTGFVANNTMVNETHQWTAAGVYQLSVQAFDDYPTEANGTPSGKTYLTVLIDAWWVDDIGYLLDEDGDGTYETFYSNETDDVTTTEYNATSGEYLLDEDGDDAWDWVYDLVTLTEYTEGEEPPEEEPEQPTDDNTIWYMLGIGMVIVVLILAAIAAITRKKEK